MNASPPGTNGPKPVSGALVNSCAMHCSRRSKHSVRTRSAWGTDYGKRGIISAPVGKTLYKQEDYFIYYTGYFSADYAGADKSCQPVGIYQSAYISGKISVHGALQTGTRRISGLLQQPQNQSKTKGLAACNSQTASPFGCLNNFYFRILSNFLGSLHNIRRRGLLYRGGFWELAGTVAVTSRVFRLSFLFPIGNNQRLATPSALCATSPSGGSASRQRFETDATWLWRALLTPPLGELAAVRPTEGSPDFIKCHFGKEKAL